MKASVPLDRSTGHPPLDIRCDSSWIGLGGQGKTVGDRWSVLEAKENGGFWRNERGTSSKGTFHRGARPEGKRKKFLVANENRQAVTAE
ncbi:hypothetical protein KM043_009157 [Ampulex compressa]|nr:hypothetical protein KM043_009157 [Ampulex compressa]